MNSDTDCSNKEKGLKYLLFLWLKRVLGLVSQAQRVHCKNNNDLLLNILCGGRGRLAFPHWGRYVDFPFTTRSLESRRVPARGHVTQQVWGPDTRGGSVHH